MSLKMHKTDKMIPGRIVVRKEKMINILCVIGTIEGLIGGEKY